MTFSSTNNGSYNIEIALIYSKYIKKWKTIEQKSWPDEINFFVFCATKKNIKIDTVSQRNLNEKISVEKIKSKRKSNKTKLRKIIYRQTQSTKKSVQNERNKTSKQQTWSYSYVRIYIYKYILHFEIDFIFQLLIKQYFNFFFCVLFFFLLSKISNKHCFKEGAEVTYVWTASHWRNMRCATRHAK